MHAGPRSWISSIRLIFTLRDEPHGKASWKACETVARVGRKGSIVSSYFITYPRVPRKIRTEEGVTVIHIKQTRKLPLLFWCQRWKGTQNDSWLEIHHTPYFVALLSSHALLPPSFTDVCLILSVDSGRVFMSSDHILQCIESFHKCYLWGTWLIVQVFPVHLNCVPASMHSASEVKVCLWWVHPAKRGIRTLNLYRFELF